MKKEINLENFHNDTIALNAHKDKKLGVQIYRLINKLSSINISSTSSVLSKETSKLLSKLEEFRSVFYGYSHVYVNEQNKRQLPNAQVSEVEPNTDLIHQIVKLQEALEDVPFRHDDTVLKIAVSDLTKKLNKYIPTYSKYCDMIGTGPVDKPSSNDNGSELEL